MKLNKVFTLLIISILSASVMLTAYPLGVLAASPSVPGFTVAYVDHSYDVPPTYGKDPYTGQTIVTNGGYHVDNRTVDVTIKYQPFTPYLEGNQTVQMYYSVRSKGHFDNWADATSIHSMDAIQPSGSGDTVVSFNIQYWNVPQGGQIDFQVQSYTAYTVNSYSGGCFTGSSTNRVAESGWSGTVTITIGDPTPATATAPPTPAPYPTDSPTYTTPYPTSTVSPYQQPTATPVFPNILTGVLSGVGWEQTALIIMAVIIACFLILVIILVRKVRTKNAQLQNLTDK
jgi:hypothetical protein